MTGGKKLLGSSGVDLAAGCLPGPLAGSTWCLSSVLQRLVDTKCSNFLLYLQTQMGRGLCQEPCIWNSCHALSRTWPLNHQGTCKARSGLCPRQEPGGDLEPDFSSLGPQLGRGWCCCAWGSGRAPPTQLSGGSQLSPWLPQDPIMSAKPTPP